MKIWLELLILLLGLRWAWPVWRVLRADLFDEPSELPDARGVSVSGRFDSVPLAHRAVRRPRGRATWHGGFGRRAS